MRTGGLVVAVLTQPALYKKTLSNVVEVKSRGAFVMAVTTVGNTEVEKTADYVIYIPETNPYFANSLAVIPLQLFGYLRFPSERGWMWISRGTWQNP